MRLLVDWTRHLPDVYLATSLTFCFIQHVFRLLAKEASHRLKALGLGQFVYPLRALGSRSRSGSIGGNGSIGDCGGVGGCVGAWY